MLGGLSGPPPVPPKKSREGGVESIVDENKSKGRFARSGNRNFLIATASVYAAMYVALTYVFSPISYGPVNFRVANLLEGLIPLMGWPAILGQTLGVFIANSRSPLGPIDLINVVPTFLFSWLIWKLRRVSVLLGLVLYSVALGITVSLALNYAFGLPLYVEIPYVTAGILVVTAFFGYLFYKAVERFGVLDRYFGK